MGEDQANRVEEGLKEEEKNELQATLDTLKELVEVKAAFVELSKKYTENEELARLKAENFENTIENEDLKAKLAASEEQSEKTKKELEKVRSEKKRLEQSVKSEKEQEGVRRREKEETEATRLELRKEKEKVAAQVEQVEAARREARDLKEENSRLYTKIEHLEALMGEEVTDINEILAVINNIQASQTLLSPKGVSQERNWI